jgi:hypothetical protein
MKIDVQEITVSISREEGLQILREMSELKVCTLEGKYPALSTLLEVIVKQFESRHIEKI